MLKITGSEDYYPTPEKLLDEITAGIKWEDVKYILEPSAGTGNICDWLKKERTGIKRYSRYGEITEYESKYYLEVDIDCIEIEPEFRAILKDKGYRVVQDDFLKFHTYKHYDLILMNPPFSVGSRHLLKALEVQSVSGGSIICILNAETIRNPYSKERQELQKLLREYGAEIEYYERAFSESENPTEVEIAVIKVTVPAPERKTTIFESLREKEYEEYERLRENNELAERDLVKSFVALYNRELEWGLRLYDEYLELRSKALDGQSLLRLNIGYDDGYNDNGKFSVNAYVREIRRKYWNKLFKHPRITGKLTSNLQSKYLSQVNTFAEYDFSEYNIKTVQIEIAQSLVQGVEDCIIGLFDELSHKHSWSEELDLGNIHYYNGWKSNSSWKINKRVVIPLQVFDDNQYSHINRHNGIETLADIERVLNYLDSGETEEKGLMSELEHCLKTGITRNISLKYFDVTFYKKGTCHITFTNERLLKKFNIFGSQKKGWLPMGYARRRYEEFNEEEQAVIESFEGRESYNDTLMESRYYLFDAGRSMPMLTAQGA